MAVEGERKEVVTVATSAKKAKPHTEVEVTWLPNCDMCHTAQARYDAKTQMGPWANLCAGCFRQYGAGLGLGKGQKLILKKGATT